VHGTMSVEVLEQQHEEMLREAQLNRLKKKRCERVARGSVPPGGPRPWRGSWRGPSVPSASSSRLRRTPARTGRDGMDEPGILIR
jgi:hypothetical protein